MRQRKQQFIKYHLFETRNLAPEDIQVAIDSFQSGRVRILMTTGYIRGLINLRTPMIIINYDMPKPDAYSRR